MARTLITRCKLRVTYDTVRLVAPVYVRDPSCGPGEQGYRSILHVKTEEDAARDVLIDEMIRISAVLARARGIAALLGRAEHLDDIERRVADFIADIQPPDDDGPHVTS